MTHWTPSFILRWTPAHCLKTLNAPDITPRSRTAVSALERGLLMQSSIRAGNWEMGGEGLRQRGGWRNGGNADSCANRHRVVSQLHTWQDGNSLHKRPRKIWEQQKRGSLSIYGGCVSAGIRRRFEKWNISVFAVPSTLLAAMPVSRDSAR